MRKSQQDVISESVNIAREALDEIKRLSHKNNIDGALNVLVDLSELLERTAGFISNVKGGDTNAAAIIVKLQNILFDMYHSAQETRRVGSSALKLVSAKITGISDLLNTELKPDRIEVLFIGSRPSTMDSMETVYAAAKADPACDVYFAYINRTGKFDDWREYKNGNIILTDLADYNIEERKPDIVFFDYPYDEFGRRFSGDVSLAKYLKRHCRLLAHVPYFISTSETGVFLDVLDYTAISGVLFSDYVFVQSEYYRNCLIRECEANYQKYPGSERKYGAAPEKFVALGSPKIDKLINAQTDTYTVPGEWEKLLYKPDGSKKIVVLYNTHFHKLHEYGGEFVERIASVLNLFQNNEDIVFWWRPHPNIATNNYPFKQADARDSYLRLIERCKLEGLAIYDDTPELHRAVSLGDVLYSDFSSLTGMFLILGKFVVVQEFGIPINGADFENENRARLNLPAAVSKISDICIQESEQCNILDMLSFLKRTRGLTAPNTKYPPFHEDMGRFENCDGQAGKRIYHFCKSKVLL